MKTYLEAYHERMQRNNDQLIELGKNILALDDSIGVYIHKDRKNIDGVVFIKGETINSIQFHEVPYHWSGCGYKNHSGGENISMPFEATDVLKTFKPITSIMHTYKEPFKNVAQYLQWCSYLKPFNLAVSA